MLRQRLPLLSLVSFLFVVLFSASHTSAQFGVPKAGEEGSAVPDHVLRETLKNDGTVEGKASVISEQDAVDMEAILVEARKDPKTMEMVEKIKNENSPELIELSKLPKEQVLIGMKETLDNLKLIEYLFQDKEKAVIEMEKEGMIEKGHLKKYKKNPELLEEDTRRGLYFNFISLSVVGGFI